ncbi:MAG: protein kinase [Acidobacteria bacterium]|nr:protein kinase [Acidobacteriota bacterium]
MIGQTLGHYRILEQLGAGGMGVVYRAHDERLDREVALKVLPAGALADQTARQRFQQEALALSRLNHPHICTIYEVGESDGQTYIAMELVEGRPLQALARDDGLPVQTALRCGAQIASALAHAHERGILHRDLKSSNVIVTPDGRAKVLDFGLAKRAAEKQGEATRTQGLTDPGTVVGTLHYMAPEVLRGEPADARSDLWALGVMLYEMLSGRLPFAGKTAFETSSAILRESPAPLPGHVPAGLRIIIQRCLAKEPGERYQQAGELRAALETAQSDTSGAAVVAPRDRPRRRVLILAGALAAAFAAALALYTGGLRWQVGPGRIESVAVLPLENLSRDPDQEYFADGMTEQLITDLSKIGSLRVISRTSVMQYKRARKPLAAIAKELKVDAVIEGSVTLSGERVRITAQLIQTSSEKNLWAESYERDLRDVLALQGDVARKIAGEIRITLTPQERMRLAGGRRVDPEVLQLYLKGQYFSNQSTEETVRKGIGYFEQALQKDPSYAPTYAGMSIAYSSLSSVYAAPHEVMPKARAAAKRALELDETLSEAHTSLATVSLFYDWDWSTAEKELKRAIELNPSSADAHNLYGTYFDALRRSEQAIAELRRAHDLDPHSLRIYGNLLGVLVTARQYDQAIEESRRALEKEPSFAFAYAWMGIAYGQKGRFPEAVAATEKAVKLDPNPTTDHFLAIAQAAAGNKSEARRVLAKLEEMAKRQYVCAYEIAEVHVSLGDHDKALQWMQRGLKEQCDCLVWLKSEPWLDPLRVDPRYLDLVKRVGFPESGSSAPTH